MRRPVRYQKNVLAAMVKETLEDPGGRTFIILIYYNTDKSIAGFIETPLKYFNISYKFSNVSEIITIMKRLVEEVNKDDRNRLAKTYMKWLRREHTMHATWAIHFWERLDGDFEGKAYHVQERRETVFYGISNLKKILSSSRGEQENAL